MNEQTFLVVIASAIIMVGIGGTAIQLAEDIARAVVVVDNGSRKQKMLNTLYRKDIR